MGAAKGRLDSTLDEDRVKAIIEKGTPASLFKEKKVLVLTPDATRTAPLPMMVRALGEVIGKRAARLDFMVALGTHKLLTEQQVLELFGLASGEKKGKLEGSRFLNHRWDLPETLVKVGRIEEDEIEETSGGLFREGIDILINRVVFDYDVLLILGPVFPHEVVGFSGGNKYLFPGISGGEFVHFFHWLGAVNTSWKTIGHKYTPTRMVVDRAASLVPVQRHCISMVVTEGNELAGLYVGTPEEAWSDAADLSARMHIVYREHPFNRVLGAAPRMYDEIWTAGKVMYKLEPVVAEGGRLIIYGPHIEEVSYTWGGYIERIGYHVRDYFLAQMEKFEEIPRAILAHSTHVRGLGSYENGIERPRIDVVLATSIPEEKCRALNLGYMNPEHLRTDEYRNKEDEGILFVDHAGETLYRLEQERPSR
jgi:nickel-dependent lactate racemase